jgi:hypothetical protein
VARDSSNLHLCCEAGVAEEQQQQQHAEEL